MNDHEPQVPETPPAPPADGEPAAAEPSASSARNARWWADRKRLAGAVGGVAVVAAVGVGGGYALGHSGSGSDTRATGQVGGPFGRGFQPGLRGQGGPGRDMAGPAAPGGSGPGGVDGEQHVSGTLTAVAGSSVTVRTTDGTSTYQVTSATQILQDGKTVTLSSLDTGQPVLVHVLPGGSGDGTAERVLAGSSATDGDFGPPSPGQTTQTS